MIYHIQWLPDELGRRLLLPMHHLRCDSQYCEAGAPNDSLSKRRTDQTLKSCTLETLLITSASSQHWHRFNSDIWTPLICRVAFVDYTCNTK